MDYLSYKNDSSRMCSVLRHSLEDFRELLEYWREKCSWPDMNLVQGFMYNFNTAAYEKEISRLEENLRIWEARKKGLLNK